MGNNKKKNNRNNRGTGQQNRTTEVQQTEYQEMFVPFRDHHNGNSSGHARGGSRHNSQSHNGSRNECPQGSANEYKPNDYQRNLESTLRLEADQEKRRKSSQQSSNYSDHHAMEKRDDGHHVKNKNGQQKSAHSEDPIQSEKLTEHSKQKRSVLQCTECEDFYNVKTRVPRGLACGHTFCTACLRLLLKKDPKCPHCQRSFKNMKAVEDIQVNFIVRDLVHQQMANDAKSEHGGAESGSCRPKNESVKPVVTQSSNKLAKGNSQSERVERMESSSSIKKSPHDSRCLEMGILPTSHCATCLKWVCDKCGNIDHHQQKECYLIPKGEALAQMTKAQVDAAKGTSESAENILRELRTYDQRLDIFALTMQAAFESISTERERVKAMMEEGGKKNKNLEAAVTARSNVNNLPVALDWLQQVEGHCNGTQQWVTGNASNILDHERINKITKEILFGTVQMKMMAGNDVQVFAQHVVAGVKLMSRLTVEGGRIFVHALDRLNTVAVGSRVLPLTSVLLCLDPCSALTFLEIGWGGQVKGRLFIRLLGDTQRGRQFVKLCTGKEGPSFRTTGFHRIWWKNLPGEHIWGGDYDKGDGSGGKSVLKMSNGDISSLVPGRCLPIEAGLVAGRYEKTDISSIFRIYTKDCKRGESSSYNMGRNSVVEKDDEAFGQVEFGLNILDEVVKQSNIQDVHIFNCGIVIET